MMTTDQKRDIILALILGLCDTLWLVVVQGTRCTRPHAAEPSHMAPTPIEQGEEPTQHTEVKA